MLRENPHPYNSEIDMPKILNILAQKATYIENIQERIDTNIVIHKEINRLYKNLDF